MIKIISTYFVIFCFAFASSAQSFPLKEAPFPDRYSEVDEFDSQCIIYPDYFEDNRNGWDLFSDKKSSSRIENGRLALESFQNNGACRLINVPELSSNYSMEVTLDFSKLKAWAKAGLIFGFKDWENYQFFVISKDRVSIGKMIDGVLLLDRDDFYSVDIKKKKTNTLKVLTVGEKVHFAINGLVQCTTIQTLPAGRGCGVIVSRYSGEVYFEDFIYKVKKRNTPLSTVLMDQDEWGEMKGMGLLFTTDGFVLTSNSAVREANSIAVDLIRSGIQRTYNAKLVIADEANDLALLQIIDSSYVPLDNISFAFYEHPNIRATAKIYTTYPKKRESEFDSRLIFNEGEVVGYSLRNKETMPEFGWKWGGLKTGPPRFYRFKFTTSFGVHNTIPGAPLFDSQAKFIGLIQHPDNNLESVAKGISLGVIMDMLSKAPVSIVLPRASFPYDLQKQNEGRLFSEYVAIIKVK